MKLTGLQHSEDTQTSSATAAPRNDDKLTFYLEFERQKNPLQHTAGHAAESPMNVASRESANEDVICLGTITKQNPTVSHLLVQNSRYRNRCWELIYASQNKDKPYKEIPLGEKIYLNPQTNEILWSNESPQSQRAMVSKSYRSVSNIAVGKSDAIYREPVADSARSMSRTRLEQPEMGSAHAKTPKISGTSQSLGEMLVNKLRRLIGTSYERMDCYELVVQGLRKLGIQYGGKDGLQQHLISKAIAHQLPRNAYLTGDGLIEASGDCIYARKIPATSNPDRKAEEIYNQLQPLLEPGLVISLSTRRRGHTGIIALHKKDWTFINSGIMDNAIHTNARRKRVGEEKLKNEISNWLRLASARNESLRLTLGRLDKDKMEAYQGKAGLPVAPTSL